MNRVPTIYLWRKNAEKDLIYVKLVNKKMVENITFCLLFWKFKIDLHRSVRILQHSRYNFWNVLLIWPQIGISAPRFPRLLFCSRRPAAPASTRGNRGRGSCLKLILQVTPLNAELLKRAHMDPTQWDSWKGRWG